MAPILPDLKDFSSVGLLARPLKNGGDDGNRPHDPLLAGQVLSQLSYTPMFGVIYLNDQWSLKIEQQRKVPLPKQVHPISPSFN